MNDNLEIDQMILGEHIDAMRAAVAGDAALAVIIRVDKKEALTPMSGFDLRDSDDETFAGMLNALLSSAQMFLDHVDDAKFSHFMIHFSDKPPIRFDGSNCKVTKTFVEY